MSEEAPAEAPTESEPTTDEEILAPNRGHDLHTDAFERALAAIGGGEEEGRAVDPQVDDPGASSIEETDQPPAEGGDAAPTEDTTPAPEDKPTSDAWVKLTQEDQRLRRERDAFKREREAFEQERAKGQAQLEAIQRIKSGEAKGGDALQALASLGLTYNDLTAAVLAQGKGANIEPLQKEIEAFKSEHQKQLEAMKAEIEEANRIRQTAEVHGAIRSHLSDDPEGKWAELKEHPNYEAEVYRTLEYAWKHAGSPMDANGQPIPQMTPQEAADRLTRQILLQKAQERFTVDKLRSLITGEQPTPEPPPASPASESEHQGTAPAPSKPANPTLTNSHAGTAPRTASTADPDACFSRALAVMTES